jgi:excisionase family DNA binding protein
MHDRSLTLSPGNGTEPPPIAYTVAGAARHLAVTDRQVYRLIERGEIRSYKSGRSRRITHAALLEYVSQCEAETNQSAA